MCSRKLGATQGYATVATCQPFSGWGVTINVATFGHRSLHAKVCNENRSHELHDDTYSFEFRHL